jgi:hypothetical protein
VAARPAAGVTLTRISAEKRGANVEGPSLFCAPLTLRACLRQSGMINSLELYGTNSLRSPIPEGLGYPTALPLRKRNLSPSCAFVSFVLTFLLIASFG